MMLGKQECLNPLLTGLVCNEVLGWCGLRGSRLNPLLTGLVCNQRLHLYMQKTSSLNPLLTGLVCNIYKCMQ